MGPCRLLDGRQVCVLIVDPVESPAPEGAHPGRRAVRERRRACEPGDGIDAETNPPEHLLEFALVGEPPRGIGRIRVGGDDCSDEAITVPQPAELGNEPPSRLEMAGRIAGQVAHDLNNLLAPLVAYPELMRMQLPPDHFFQEY